MANKQVPSAQHTTRYKPMHIQQMNLAPIRRKINLAFPSPLLEQTARDKLGYAGAEDSIVRTS